MTRRCQLSPAATWFQALSGSGRQLIQDAQTGQFYAVYLYTFCLFLGAEELFITHTRNKRNRIHHAISAKVRHWAARGLSFLGNVRVAKQVLAATPVVPSQLPTALRTVA